jgi:hypothetical protein
MLRSNHHSVPSFPRAHPFALVGVLCSQTVLQIGFEILSYVFFLFTELLKITNVDSDFVIIKYVSG